MPTVLNNIGISGDYGQIVFHNDGTDNIIDLSHSNARIVTHDLSINNTLQAGQILGTKSGKVIELSGNALLVPVGTDNQRPDNASGAVGVGEIGMIRYNTTSNTFEGYGPTAWGSLGGVINTQQNTFVEAVDEHSNHDISSNSIQFTTSGELVAVINSDGNVGIGTSNPLSKLDVYDGNVTIRPAAPVSGAAFNSDGALILTNGGYETNSTVPQIKFGFGNVYNNNYFSYMLSRHDTAASSDANSCALDFRINSGVPGSSTPTTGTALALSLTGAGRVGIGITNPSEALDVSGNIIINGQIMGKGTGTGGNSDTYFGLRHANPVGFTHNQILLRTNGDIYLGSKSDREISFYNGDPAIRANEFMRLQNGDLILYDGDISLNGNILAIGDISLNGKLYATGDVSFNENINVGGDASFNSSLSIDGDLNVDTNATISGNLDIKTNATVDNDLHVKNDATIDNDVVVNGSGTIEKDFHIKRHLTVDGSLSFLGDFIQRDTIIQVTEQMDLSNDGTGPALIVRQHGAQPVATFYDDTTMAMIIKDGGDVSFNSNVVVDGSVGIGSNAPSELLDICGGNIRVHNGYNLYIGDTVTDSLRFQHITNGTSYIDYNTNKPLYFRTTTTGSSTNVMHLRQNGYVGIMATGLAGARLDVRNESDSVPALNVRQDDDAANIAEFHHGANQVMVIDNSGRLGIGITNPAQQLEVSGNINVTGTQISIDRPSSGNYCYFSGQDSYTVFSGANNNVLRSINGFIQMITGTGVNATSEKARITSTGLFGIGTDGPSTRLDISNNTSNSVLAVRQHDLAENIAEFYNGANQVMVIDNTGRLGIGLTQPHGGYVLDVSGNIRVSNGNQILIDAEPGNFGYFTGTDTYTVFQGNNNTQLRANNGAIEMYTGPTLNAKERLHIKSDGLIGIGTDGPSTRLDISNNTSNSVLAIRQYDLAENLAEFYNGTNQVMVIDNSGSLGINRSNVTAGFALDVSGAAIVSNTLRIRDDAQPEGGEFVIEGPSDSNRFHLDVTSYGNFRIFKTPNPTGHALFIDNTTNFIGLNGASPAVELDISGTGALRIPVGNNTSDRPSGANGMIRYNNTDNRYEGYDETNARWDSLGGGGGSGNLETNIRTLNQGDTLFNIDVSGNTAGFSAHKVSMSDDGNRVAIVDSTVHDSHTTDATVKIYDYNVNNNLYEVKHTITFERNGTTDDFDEEGIRGIHMTGDKNTILVVTANITGTNANASDFDGSYNFIPYELTSSDPVTYTPGTSFTVDNAPWYDMDEGTTLMIAKKNATGSNRDVYFYNYSGSNKEFTLSQTIDYATDISNALPAGFDESTTAPKHVAISGNGLRALWVEEDRTNIIVFKRLSTFADFQILQTIQLNGVIGEAFTLPNLDYDGKFMAVSMSGTGGVGNEIRIYAYDETKFNYVLESSFNEIATLDDDDSLGKREAHISKDGTRLFVGCNIADNGSTQGTGAIAMLKLDKQGKVPVSSGIATAEYIAYGPTTDSYLGMGLSTDYNGKRMIGVGDNLTGNSNVRVIQTQEDSITMSSTYDINELKTSSGRLTLSPYNNIVDISANVGIGTTNPLSKLDVYDGNVTIRPKAPVSGAAFNSDGALILTNGGYETNSTVPQIKFGFGNLYSNNYFSYMLSRHDTGANKCALDFRINSGVPGSSAPTSGTELALTLTGAGRVGIGTTLPLSKCQIGGSTKYNRDDLDHGTNDALAVIIPTPTSNSVLNDPHDALILVRKGTPGISWQAQAHLRLSRYEHIQQYARTRLDFALGHDNLGDYGAAPPDVMTLLSNGHLGIGTSPTYPLDVKGSTELAADSGGRSVYLTSGLDSAYTSTNDVTIQSEKDVKATAYIATSDERIKKDILDINDDAALQKLRIIEPKTYKYKDVANRGTKTVFGFIAQQIDTVLPEAVSKLNDVIPNTYELCNATSSSNNDYYDTIHFTDFNTANLDASSNNLVLVDANNKKQSVNILSVLDSSSVQVDTDLSEWMGAVDASNETVIANEVQKYKKVILDANNIVVLENYDITSIASMDASDNVVGKMADLSGDNTIDSYNNYLDASGNFIAVVNSDGHYIDASGNYFDTNGNFMDASNNLVGTYKTEWKKVTINGTKIFVYGQHVDDFHALNKDYIFTVATAALQEVDRQLQAEKAKVSVLESDLTTEKAKTATLESQMADLLTRVSALESA